MLSQLQHVKKLLYTLIRTYNSHEKAKSTSVLHTNHLPSGKPIDMDNWDRNQLNIFPVGQYWIVPT